MAGPLMAQIRVDVSWVRARNALYAWFSSPMASGVDHVVDRPLHVALHVAGG